MCGLLFLIGVIGIMAIADEMVRTISRPVQNTKLNEEPAEKSAEE